MPSKAWLLIAAVEVLRHPLQCTAMVLERLAEVLRHAR